MAVRAIRCFPDRILSEACQPVRHPAAALTLVHDLRETLRSTPGVGLAACQIGVSLRVAIVDVSLARKLPEGSSNQGELILINPTLLSGTGEQIPREGCLSVPDLLANVLRHLEVVVRTDTFHGDERIIRGRGFEALALQHEIDHLEGKLFLDRVANLKTDLFRRKTY